MPISEDTFNDQSTRLIGHYRPGEPTDRFPDWLEEVYDAFLESERVTDATFAAAVSACIKTRTDHRLPLVAELKLYVEAEWLAYRREQEKALPAPRIEPTAPDADTFALNVAIGRARVRRRRGLIDEYRQRNGLHKHAPVPEDVWRGRDEPNDAEVNAVLAETAASPA